MKTRHVLIIGAGLAGCALAESFSRRRWQVTVLEAGARPGGVVAPLPLIAQHPAISPDFDRRSRLLIAALTHHAALRAGPAADIQPAFETCGRLQPMEPTLARRCAAHVPETVARAVGGLHETPMALPPEGSIPGLWFPDVAALSPARWWAQVLRRHNVRLCLNTPVGRIEGWQPNEERQPRNECTSPDEGLSQDAGKQAHQHLKCANFSDKSDCPPTPCWQAFSPDGMLIATADVLVLACQADAFRLAGMQEDDHGRLRFAPARVWVAVAADSRSAPPDPADRADAGDAGEDRTPLTLTVDGAGGLPADPGFPPLAPIRSERGLCLERPGRFWLHNDEYHRHWLASLEARSESQPESPPGSPPNFRPELPPDSGYDEARSLRLPDGRAGAHPADTTSPPRIDGRYWHPSEPGERLQLRDNLPMIGEAPDLARIALIADDLARNDRLPIPRRAGLHLLTGLAGRGSLYAAIGAEMIAASASGDPSPVAPDLQAATDPARFIKRRLQRAWSRR